MPDVPVGPAAFRAPWNLPLVERVRMFQAESVKVAYYDHDPGNSSFRYRCFNVVRAINAHVPGVSAGWFWESDGERLDAIVREADVLVVCRVLYSNRIAELIAAARRFGTRVLFDVDDLVFDSSVIPLLVTTLNQRLEDPDAEEFLWNAWFGWAGRLRQTMSLVDEFIVTNEFLADRVRESFDKPVHVVPNFMGQEQIDYSKAIVAEGLATGPRTDGLIQLGYFSGTPTHNRDFAILAPALARLLRSDESVRLRVVGFLDLGDFEMDGLEDRIEMHPVTDYMNLQRLIAGTQVNLAPLQDNVFTNCKSELKYFDAGAVAVPTLASPTFAMSRAIEHGVSGMLVRVDEWDERLRGIVSDYPDRGRQMGLAAYHHTMATYTPAAMADTVARALGFQTARTG